MPGGRDFFAIGIGSGNEISAVGLSGLEKKVNWFSTFFVRDQTLLGLIGEYLVTKIKVRTAKGETPLGNDFEPYTDRYRKVREDAGLPTKPPDLFFTGAMMNSLTAKPEILERQVRIFFMPGQDESGVSNPAKAFWLQEKRPFFGYNMDDRIKIREMVQKYARRELRRKR